jgi:5-methylthioadenosine/S-adenosylhomocysteine deaminase
MTRRGCFACLVMLAISSAARADEAVPSEPWVLRGTVVAPDGVIEDGAVRISGQKIEWVGPWETQPPGTRVVETQGTIYPGLIDLHNHLTWNVFPRWKAGRLFPNRYEWQQVPAYKKALEDPQAALIRKGLGTRMARFAEVKALAGGVTSLAGLWAGDLPRGTASSYHQMLRMIDLHSGFYPPGEPEKVSYHVFPLLMIEPVAAKMRSDLAGGQVNCLLVHVGEGSPEDASSIMEFKLLKARGLLLPGVNIIHGVALHAPEFAEMQGLGIGLVWSPRSNIELYGATADVAGALAAKVTVAIAPDWSPTGSDGMIDELRYAAAWSAAQPNSPVDDRMLFRMATVNAATIARLDDRIGSIRPGLYADLLVLNQRAPDAYAELDHATAADVGMVVISGEAVYGDGALVRSTRPTATWTQVAVGSSTKSVALPNRSPDEDWAHTTSSLEAALEAEGTSLSPLSEGP